jgi:hypothetical protein
LAVDRVVAVEPVAVGVGAVTIADHLQAERSEVIDSVALDHDEVLAGCEVLDSDRFRIAAVLAGQACGRVAVITAGVVGQDEHPGIEGRIRGDDCGHGGFRVQRQQVIGLQAVHRPGDAAIRVIGDVVAAAGRVAVDQVAAVDGDGVGADGLGLGGCGQQQGQATACNGDGLNRFHRKAPPPR